ncbi:MFS general substrate transporter [Westerdykella ornata]|uniref:MFS general substrate transporter n=1 Tax=Westerdykella ornata TaxID=318751 RepID=A0A6A6J893_WESOR|nr:MFS general substrate transporter [Westerdykella ornata]KAF2271856.1 MFS general substrate transporter [Westerdykella ornata]
MPFTLSHPFKAKADAEGKTTSSPPQTQEVAIEDDADDESLLASLTTEKGKRIPCEPEGIVDGLTAHSWPSWKKSTVLTVVAVCQTSMNFNAAIYSNAIDGINEHFGVSDAHMGRDPSLNTGMFAFLVPYAFGCELWAPWSEELGRHWVMQISLLCVNLSIVMCATANTFPQMIAGRVLGGLSSAGGSVTLGMVADMFHPKDQQPPVAWASLWSCLGAVVGGICGGPLQQYTNWRMIFYVQLAFGTFAQLLQLSVSRETRATCLLDREAIRRRQATGEEIYGRTEITSFWERLEPKHMVKTFARPFTMLFTEPIVLCLSLLSGFADALVFMFFESYGLVFAQWSFTPTDIRLVLLSLAGAYWITYAGYFPMFARHRRLRSKGNELAPETRLSLLCFVVWALPLGLLGSAFAGTSSWGGMVFCTFLIGMANWAIYFATIDYMVEAYGSYSASATGGNGFARDFLAGLCVLYTKPMFKALGIRNTFLVLFAASFFLCIPVVVFYRWGHVVRQKSRFAQKIKAQRARDERVAELIVARRAKKAATESSSTVATEASEKEARWPSITEPAPATGATVVETMV